MLMRFEELPGNVQALMLAKLAMEMRAANAHSIHHLAKIKGSNVADLWRAVCCKAAQPVCTVPIAAMPGS